MNQSRWVKGLVRLLLHRLLGWEWHSPLLRKGEGRWKDYEVKREKGETCEFDTTRELHQGPGLASTQFSASHSRSSQQTRISELTVDSVFENPLLATPFYTKH
jgi:hypothetical protein